MAKKNAVQSLSGKLKEIKAVINEIRNMSGRSSKEVLGDMKNRTTRMEKTGNKI